MDGKLRFLPKRWAARLPVAAGGAKSHTHVNPRVFAGAFSPRSGLRDRERRDGDLIVRLKFLPHDLRGALFGHLSVLATGE